MVTVTEDGTDVSAYSELTDLLFINLTYEKSTFSTLAGTQCTYLIRKTYIFFQIQTGIS